jgi:peptidyl-prolyl cis-trans isomerase A (cyclophilin A)
VNRRLGPTALLFVVCIAVSACAEHTGCSTEAPIGSSLLTSPGDTLFRATAPDTFIARFNTSRGDFYVQVVREWAPRGADRFYNLVRAGFYDGTRFYRVVPGFVVQWGIHGDPAVSEVWARQCISDDPVKRSNTYPTITFAFGKPNTRTTQVFINYGMNASLNRHGFAPFGEVMHGKEVVDSLYAGYGEMGPRGTGVDPVRAVKEGNAYLRANFPQLDSVITARIVAQR